MIYAEVFSLIVVLVAILAIVAQARRNAARAEVLEALAVPLAEEQIEDNIREDIAPKNRPYGDHGIARDDRGRTYAIAKNGSLRRFAFAEKSTGEMDVVLVQKPGKALRKAAKRAKRADRGLIVKPLPAAAGPESL